MGAKAARLKIRLFLEGIEVPCISAQVQCEPNSPAVASIQIPPLGEGIRLLPRTLVHVFFLDFYESESPLVSLRGKMEPKGEKNNPTVYEQKLNANEDVEDEARNERYKLLFCGELVGFQYTKSEAQRALVLQCQDLSNYWDYAQQWENTDLFGPGYKAMFSGGSTNMFTDFLSTKDEEIVKALLTPSSQYPALKGLLGGIIHLLEKIGGSYYGEKKFGGQNLFYSLAELRLKITQTITAYAGDDTANKLLNAQGYEGLFGRILGNLGQQVSFRQAIVALMQCIFHETYAVPTPRYVPGTYGTVSGSKRTKYRDIPSLSSFPIEGELVANGIKALLTRLDEFASALTGVTASTLTPAVIASMQADSVGFNNALKQERKTLTDLTNRANQLKAKEAAKIFTVTNSILSRVQTKISQGFKPSLRTEVRDLLNQALSTVSRASALEKVESNPKKAIPARLNSQIFRPDIWFTSPPRCNVLFPDQYTSVTYARNFMQEPTRLMLKTNDAFFGEDELFDQFYFAPKAVTTRQEKRNLQAVLSGELMDHELFTGILPVFEKMSETNIFAVKSGAVDGKMPKIGLAQRTTNFLYFKYRFAARQMQISARFNPYIAPGFPGLIVDRYVDLQKIKEYNDLISAKVGTERNARSSLGVHYLTNFAGITHTVSQQAGGTTMITGTYARDYDESVEFLGAIELDQEEKQNKKVGNATRTTDVAALSPPAIGSMGPGFGIITKVEDVTDTYTSAYTSADDAKALPLYRGPRRAGKNEFRDRVIVGVAQQARGYGPAVEAMVANPFQALTFAAYRVTEMVPKYRLEKVDLPAEAYICPGWYGEAWTTTNVGKVYDTFFGTGSITDPTQIADPDGSATGLPYADAEDAQITGSQSTGIDDPRNFAPALLSLEEKSSIAQAVAFLVLSYSYVRQAGLDADEFIRAYTWRPIASLPDMFGSSDLTLTEDGLGVVKGIEGFHSRAFGPYEDLFGLVPVEIEDILDMNKASKAAERNDTRKRKYVAVQEYLSQLKYSRALVG